MTNFVFVHGGNVHSTTWNKVVNRNEFPIECSLGGKVWLNISLELERSGHTTYTPTLANEYENDLSSHIEQIYQLINSANLDKFVLVGHSYGGMILTGLAEKMTTKINHLVYVDAALPDPDQSLFDLLRLGGLEPNDIIEGKPKAYVQKIKYKPEFLQEIPKTSGLTQNYK